VFYWLFYAIFKALNNQFYCRIIAAFFMLFAPARAGGSLPD
jgi:hypothetical protein